VILCGKKRKHICWLLEGNNYNMSASGRGGVKDELSLLGRFGAV
jgi:hypothetical protein